MKSDDYAAWGSRLDARLKLKAVFSNVGLDWCDVVRQALVLIKPSDNEEVIIAGAPSLQDPWLYYSRDMAGAFDELWQEVVCEDSENRGCFLIGVAPKGFVASLPEFQGF